MERSLQAKAMETPVVIHREHELHSHRNYWRVKRFLDVLLSGTALIVLSPILLVISLVIVLDDPRGGPIFSQKRCGRDGVLFDFYKFRTMVVDAEERLSELQHKNEMDGPVFKIKDDPRITRVGRFLRKTSLDELPQLWNVFRGDMSIVGPRPALPREVQKYDAYQSQRLYVTPGLTCYWQVTPHRNDCTFDEWVALDVKYIKERTLWIDFKLVLKTIKVMLTAEGE